MARLNKAISGFLVDEILKCVLDLQALALTFATKFVLYKQDVGHLRLKKTSKEGWMRLVELQESLTGGELPSKGVHFAILEVWPSLCFGEVQIPSLEEIKKAFHLKAKQFHADKEQSRIDRRTRRSVSLAGEDTMMQKVNAAKEFLFEESNRHGFKGQLGSLFFVRLKCLREQKTARIKELLEEQAYSKLKRVLDSVKMADRQVADKMNVSTDDIWRSIEQQLVSEVRRAQATVEAKWREGLLRDLHEELSKLKQMSKELAEYSEIVPCDLISEISEEVNEKILTEGLAAQQCLTRCVSLKDAMEHIWQFGGHLIQLGHICTNLGDFKAQSELQVTSALNICYEKLWGASFLFELGMRLGQGKIGDPKTDATVAKVILNTFRHFEDVHTVIFNRETRATQKAMSETLKDAGDRLQKTFFLSRSFDSFLFVELGNVTESTSHRDSSKEVSSMEVSADGSHKSKKVPADKLLEGWNLYDQKFDEHLKDWLAGEQTADKMAQEVMAAAATLRQTGSAVWSAEIKEQIPELLAGIFALYSMIRSGDSYHRFGETANRSLTNGATDADAEAVSPEER